MRMLVSRAGLPLPQGKNGVIDCAHCFTHLPQLNDSSVCVTMPAQCPYQCCGQEHVQIRVWVNALQREVGGTKALERWVGDPAPSADICGWSPSAAHRQVTLWSDECSLLSPESQSHHYPVSPVLPFLGRTYQRSRHRSLASHTLKHICNFKHSTKFLMSFIRAVSGHHTVTLWITWPEDNCLGLQWVKFLKLHNGTLIIYIKITMF